MNDDFTTAMDRSAYCAQVLSRLRRLSREEREAVKRAIEERLYDIFCKYVSS